VCCAGSRLFVQEDVKDQFIDRLKEKSAKIVVGDPMDKATNMGPQVSQEQLNRVKSYADIARGEGATVVAGGECPTLEGAFQNGYFYQPTIFSGVKNQMRIAQEEIFGPVLSLIRVPDNESALSVANNVRFGLSASVYTNDVAAMFKFVDRLDAGILHVNSPTVGGEAHVPFGGMKATGVGLREMGRVAIDFYTELKVVYVDYTGGVRKTNLY